jgi:hypothetical protein
MGTLVCFHVRCQNAADLESLRKTYPRAHIATLPGFAAIELPPGDPFDGRELDRLSRTSGEAIFLGFSSTSNAFGFTRSVEGTSRRHLRFGYCQEEGLWEEVSGDPEPWEDAAFFEGADPELQAVDEQAEEIYRLRVVRAGEVSPWVDAREAARTVAGHYGFAGWGETTSETETAGAEVVPDEKPWWKFW